MSVQPPKTLKQRLNTRNLIAVIFVIGYFGFLFYAVEKKLGSDDNPVLSIMLGIMSAALILITQFYFRRAEPQ